MRTTGKRYPLGTALPRAVGAPSLSHLTIRPLQGHQWRVSPPAEVLPAAKVVASAPVYEAITSTMTCWRPARWVKLKMFGSRRTRSSQTMRGAPLATAGTASSSTPQRHNLWVSAAISSRTRIKTSRVAWPRSTRMQPLKIIWRMRLSVQLTTSRSKRSICRSQIWTTSHPRWIPT